MTIRYVGGGQPTKTYGVRVVTLSGTTITELHDESAVHSAAAQAGDYLTFELSSPFSLSPDTQYGFDVRMTASTSGWQTGIPTVTRGNNNYSGGEYYTCSQWTDGDKGNWTSTDLALAIPATDRDWVFHLDMEAVGGPAPPSLTLGSRVLVSTNNANFDISVFDGAASYNDRGVGGSEPGTPTFTNTFGDGTVEDYNFFHSPNESIVSYAKGTAGLISDGTSDASNINGSGENWSNVWTTSDPGVNFDTTKDFTNGSVPNTFARTADITGTIDISGLESGTVYIPHGTYINQWDLTLTMSGDGQPDLVALDEQTSNGPGTNFGWITDFDFNNPGLLYDTITYEYWNADRDGSRARFMGVILDGTAPIIPEPSTFALAALALLGLGCFGRRRRRVA